MPTSKQPRLGAHELKYVAQELGQAVRALVDLHVSLREELFLAAKVVRREKRAKRDMPKCNALKASGGRCATRLDLATVRCGHHEQELRDRRRAKAAKRKPGGGGEGGAATVTPESTDRNGGGSGDPRDKDRRTHTPHRDVSRGPVVAANEGRCGNAECGRERSSRSAVHAPGDPSSDPALTASVSQLAIASAATCLRTR